MATLYGTEYNNAYVTKPSVKIPPGRQSGDKKILYFEYPITAAPTANDVIKVGRLPKGAMVLNAGLKFGDLGTAGVLELGHSANLNSGDTTVAADPDAFLAGVDVNAAADYVTMDQQQEAGGALAGQYKEFASEVDVEIFVTTAWTVTSGTIKGHIEYVTI